MHTGAWQATVYGVTKSQTGLSDCQFLSDNVHGRKIIVLKKSKTQIKPSKANQATIIFVDNWICFSEIHMCSLVAQQ